MSWCACMHTVWCACMQLVDIWSRAVESGCEMSCMRGNHFPYLNSPGQRVRALLAALRQRLQMNGLGMRQPARWQRLEFTARHGGQLAVVGRLRGRGQGVAAPAWGTRCRAHGICSVCRGCVKPHSPSEVAATGARAYGATASTPTLAPQAAHLRLFMCSYFAK